MKIAIAKNAGFCMGVRRAVEMALDASNRTAGPIYSYGPLIHNPQVLDVLGKKGVSVIKEAPGEASGTVIIRAHGVPPKDREALIQAGFNLIDATCPKVIKVQSIIARHARQGYAVIIIGDRTHPEVKGLLGYAGENGYVADSIEALEVLPVFDQAIIVAQTTQNTELFRRVSSWAATHHPHYRIFNTICDSTEKRQDEVRRFAAGVDAIVVVGGYNSGNTQRLFEIARETGKPALHIETEADLDLSRLGDAQRIGITAGASTPNWVIKRVYRKLENLLILRKSRLTRWVYRLQRSLLLSNLYLAAGAGGLSYASALLQGISPRINSIAIAVLYLLCMHMFNNLVDSTSDRYNDPDRAMFYQKNRILLSVSAFAAGVACLSVAYLMGMLFFVLLVCMCFTGIVYIASLVPRGFALKIQPKIREIPGSKTILVAMAWGITTTVIPAIYGFGQIRGITLLVFFWAVCLVFVRTAFFDILDIQGSRIVGKETLPILLGESRTMRLLKILSLFAAALLFSASGAGVLSPLGYLMAICPLSMLTLLYAHEREGFSPGLRQCFLMESHFILAGLIALVWSAV